VAAADEDKMKVTQEEASLQIFSMADKNGDGYLSFDECKSLADCTDDIGLSEEDYDFFCETVGADREKGLKPEHVVQMYCEMNIGDALQDWEQLRKLDLEGADQLQPSSSGPLETLEEESEEFI
jgi:hypothetical protein